MRTWRRIRDALDGGTGLDLPMEQQVTLWANDHLVAGSAGSNMFGLAFSAATRAGPADQFAELGSVFRIDAACRKRKRADDLYRPRHGEDQHAPWSVDPADLACEVDRWLG